MCLPKASEFMKCVFQTYYLTTTRLLNIFVITVCKIKNENNKEIRRKSLSMSHDYNCKNTIFTLYVKHSSFCQHPKR